MGEKLYYTADEAMEALNMPRTTFYKRVDGGEIPHEIAKGHKRGMKFPKEAIDAHAKMLKRGKKAKLRFQRATNADLWQRIQYDRELYGEEDIISYRRALEWKEINDEIFMMVKEGEELVGTVTFVPLEEGVIHSLLNDRIREKNIPDWAIKKWTDPQLSVYVATISTFPSEDKTQDKERGRFLIGQTIKWALTLHQQYDIKNWYGIPATEQGLKLLQDLEFTPVQGKRSGYVLEDIENAAKVIKALLVGMERSE